MSTARHAWTSCLPQLYPGRAGVEKQLLGGNCSSQAEAQKHKQAQPHGSQGTSNDCTSHTSTATSGAHPVCTGAPSGSYPQGPFPQMGVHPGLSCSQALRPGFHRPVSTHDFSRPLGHPQGGMAQGPSTSTLHIQEHKCQGQPGCKEGPSPPPCQESSARGNCHLGSLPSGGRG